MGGPAMIAAGPRSPGHLWQRLDRLHLLCRLGRATIAVHGWRQFHWVAVAPRLGVHDIEFMLLCSMPEGLMLSAWSGAVLCPAEKLQVGAAQGSPQIDFMHVRCSSECLVA